MIIVNNNVEGAVDSLKESYMRGWEGEGPQCHAHGQAQITYHWWKVQSCGCNRIEIPTKTQENEKANFG